MTLPLPDDTGNSGRGSGDVLEIFNTETLHEGIYHLTNEGIDLAMLDPEIPDSPGIDSIDEPGDRSRSIDSDSDRSLQ